MKYKVFYSLAHKIRNNKWISVTGWKRLEKKVREMEIKRYQLAKREPVGFS